VKLIRSCAAPLFFLDCTPRLFWAEVLNEH
jgi:hypothetical protein